MPVDFSPIYHIYSLSFQDSNGDGRGDLKGIISRLDYLAGGVDSLGVGAIWLSPVCVSPMADFGYDVADYEQIDPLFGSLADFDELVKQAHARDLKVIMDFVLNHTSAEHPWFEESRADKANAKRDWYIWRPARADGSPPNNWLSVFGGSAWQLDAATGEYYLHSFLPEQPDLNWRHPEVKRQMLEALRFWLRRGVDGFRLDATYLIYKDALFRDDPANPDYLLGVGIPYYSLEHKYSGYQPELAGLLVEISQTVRAGGGRLLLCETNEQVTVEQLAAMQRLGGEPAGLVPLNYRFINLDWSAVAYRDFVGRLDAAVGGGLPNYSLSNHDNPRVAARLGAPRARLLALLQLTLRGLPAIYYGDELGMEGVSIVQSRQLDTAAHQPTGAIPGRDAERMPMQWDASANAGFSAGRPWLPAEAGYAERNVEHEAADPASMLSFYREMIRLRKTSPALRLGSYESIDTDNEQIYLYARRHEKETLLVA